MAVYYVPKKGNRELSAILTVDFGSVDAKFTKDGEERRYPSGVAHFLEHQIFETTEIEDASQLLTKLGSESNAFTSFDRTSYFFSTTDSLEESLDLLLEFTSCLHISKDTVDKERLVISQEIAMYEDDPESMLYSGVLANLYPNSVLAEDIAGTQESIDEIDQQTLKENFDIFYRPSFKSLVIVGDFSVKEIDRLVRKRETRHRKQVPHFSKLSVDMMPVISKSSIRMEVASPKLALGFRGDLNEDYSLLEHRLGLRLYLAMLFGWTSLRYHDWYDSGKIDDSFDIEIEISKSYAFVIITLDTEAPIAIGSQIRKTLKAIKGNPDVTIEHLNLIKNEIYGEFIKSLDTVEDLGHQFLSHLDESYTYFDFPELLHKLDFNTVLKIGEAFFAKDERTEFIIFPK